jgi:hypothetical protein
VEDCFAMAKDGFVFKQATELNKKPSSSQSPVGTVYLGMCVVHFGKI